MDSALGGVQDVSEPLPADLLQALESTEKDPNTGLASSKLRNLLNYLYIGLDTVQSRQCKYVMDF